MHCWIPSSATQQTERGNNVVSCLLCSWVYSYYVHKYTILTHNMWTWIELIVTPVFLLLTLCKSNGYLSQHKAYSLHLRIFWNFCFGSFHGSLCIISEIKFLIFYLGRFLETWTRSSLRKKLCNFRIRSITKHMQFGIHFPKVFCGLISKVYFGKCSGASYGF